MSTKKNEVTEQTPEERFDAITTLRFKIEDHFLALGEIFAGIKRSQAFRIKGYPTFKDFVETDLKLTVFLANRLIGIYQLYIEELDIDSEDIKKIGMDRLAMIKSIVAKATYEEQEAWIEKARTLSTHDLKDEIKKIRDKDKKKELSLKDVLAEQFVETFTTRFNCSKKELMFKLALFFNYLEENKISFHELLDSRLKAKELKKALKQQGSHEELEKAVKKSLIICERAELTEEIRFIIKLEQRKFEEEAGNLKDTTTLAKAGTTATPTEVDNG
jgi:hypothetical protein